MSRRSPTPLPGVGLLDPVPGEDVTGTLTFNASRWLAQVNGAAAVDATITGPAASGGRGTIIGATRDPHRGDSYRRRGTACALVHPDAASAHLALFARVLPHLGVLSHNEVPPQVHVASLATLD